MGVAAALAMGDAPVTVPSRLAAEWRRKLKASGFEDLEQPRDPDGFLSRRGASRLVIPPTPVGFSGDAGEPDEAIDTESNATYYAAMRNLLATGRWNSTATKLVVQYHCDGMGLQQIAATIPMPLRRVVKIVNRAQERIGAKTPINPVNYSRAAVRRIDVHMSLKELICFARKITKLTTSDFSRGLNVNG